MVKNWRATREYRVWRVRVIRRDKVCQCCGDSQSRQAHHIENGSHNPNLRFEVDNGILLCKGCHSQLHTNYKHSFREKTTRKDLENFLLLIAHFKNLHTVQVIDKIQSELLLIKLK